MALMIQEDNCWYCEEVKEVCHTDGGCKDCCVCGPESRDFDSEHKEKQMIDAKQAASLYVQPAFTEEEIDGLIRAAATKGNCMVIPKLRLSDAMKTKMEASGYRLGESGIQWFVSWENAEAA